MGALAACLDGSSALGPGVVERMLQAVPHRGGVLKVGALGLCRIGVTDTGTNTETSLAIRNGLAVALCGRIDNLHDLMSDASHADAQASPAAAVLEAFRRSGDGIVARLRGAFAGVVTDGSSIRAFRDHVGFGLLHYREEGTAVYVGTEAKQILAGAELPREPEPDFIEGLLFDRYSDQSLCAFRGVRRLPQGSMLSAVGAGIRCARFWRPELLLETDRPRDDEIKERFDRLMSQAVARVMTGNVVIALSGGIDSPAVAAYAAGEHRHRFGRPLPALSAVHPRLPTLDERAAVELVARDLGLELNLYEPQSGTFDDLRERVRREDGPAPSSFSRWRELYDHARELGFRTILSGAHAEFVIDVGRAQLLTHLVEGRRVRAVVGLLRHQRARGVPIAGLARQLASALAPAAFREIYTNRRRRRHGYGPDWLDTARFTHAGPADIRQLSPWEQAQIVTLFLPRLAIEADEIEQAASGVRVRYPWADVDLWEFFLSLRAETKYPDIWPSKLLVRHLLRGKVPDEIVDRREKTIVDDSVMRLIDYGPLRDLLVDPPNRISGVNYARLSEHLRRQDLPARDFRYVRILAAIHAFLEDWRHSA